MFYFLYYSLENVNIMQVLNENNKLNFIDTSLDGKFSIIGLLTGWLLLNIAAFGFDQDMTKKEFHQQMPVEFWREVVDRINNEMPQTLLLAEAFWLMEGYFVRTLGMHRAYNSAFMHMMMKEENSKYRELIYNNLEFEPEILTRYVNFMRNPDEETAIDQFGNGDKYFGVLTLMITLPRLPMFAHGQI